MNLVFLIPLFPSFTRADEHDDGPGNLQHVHVHVTVPISKVLVHIFLDVRQLEPSSGKDCTPVNIAPAGIFVHNRVFALFMMPLIAVGHSKFHTRMH
jgi:hypothetical protein